MGYSVQYACKIQSRSYRGWGFLPESWLNDYIEQHNETRRWNLVKLNRFQIMRIGYEIMKIDGTTTEEITGRKHSSTVKIS